MPRPPKLDELTELSFITNYFMQGCAPPFWLFVELSKEPVGDLALLILGIDGFDIAQAIFGPKGSRNRSSGRHGRKSRRHRLNFDPNDFVGGKVRGVVNPYDALDFGPLRKAFRIYNVYEGFNFSAALVEGLTDVGFETLWGVITVNDKNCSTLPYLTRQRESGDAMVGVAPWSTAFNVSQKLNENLFQSIDGTSWNCHVSDYTVGAAATVYAASGAGLRDFRLTIRSLQSGVLAESSWVSMDQGDSIRLSVEAEVPAGEATYLARSVEFGSVVLYGTDVMCFGGTFF